MTIEQDENDPIPVSRRQETGVSRPHSNPMLYEIRDKCIQLYTTNRWFLNYPLPNWKDYDSATRILLSVSVKEIS